MASDEETRLDKALARLQQATRELADLFFTMGGHGFGQWAYYDQGPLVAVKRCEACNAAITVQINRPMLDIPISVVIIHPRVRCEGWYPEDLPTVHVDAFRFEWL